MKMSNNPLDRNDLPKETQEEIKRILAKGNSNHCTEQELGFLQARRDYLTQEEYSAFFPKSSKASDKDDAPKPLSEAALKKLVKSLEKAKVEIPADADEATLVALAEEHLKEE